LDYVTDIGKEGVRVIAGENFGGLGKQGKTGIRPQLASEWLGESFRKNENLEFIQKEKETEIPTTKQLWGYQKKTED